MTVHLSPKKPTSAASLEIPGLTSPPYPPQMQEADDDPEVIAALFRELRQLKRQYGAGTNKDQLAELLIGATILNGLDHGRRITGTLEKLGMNRRHAGMILSRFTGVLWQRGPDGRYSLID